MASTQGLDRLKKQIGSLPKAVVEAVEYQMSENAYELADAVKQYAPHKTGALTDSVGFGPGDPPEGAALMPTIAPDPVGDALATRGLKWSVWAGNRKAFYARWVEFGTRASNMGDKVGEGDRTRTAGRTHPGTKAQPFFYPAVRAKTDRFKTSISRAANAAAKVAAGKR